MTTPTKRAACFFWPLAATWRLVAAIVTLAGRMAAAIAGIAIVIAGFCLTLTLVGAVLGIPLIIFGILLIGRSLFG